ncbi:MAG: LacI family DNA-binding transcriptional regulator [Eubacteriales bacterium]|nr:LacI family DNA-binding transcriptional regulator [Eubacteriales bacterium]
MASVKSVAELAGVGIGTVSRVINNHPAVKPETRDRVLEAIRALNYTPNEVARNFKMQKSMMVALLLPAVNHPFFAELAYYIEDELDQQNYKLILCNSKGKPQKELYYFDVLNKNKVAGIIAITYNNVDQSVTGDIPVITIDRHISHEIACVTSDNFNGGRVAFNELLKAGVKHPAFLGYTRDPFINTANSEVELRKEGYLGEAQSRQIKCPNLEIPDIEGDLGERILKLFETGALNEIDGIFINGDVFASRFIKVATQRGIRVPEDLKVIGYDGLAKSSWDQSQLSSIQQPLEDMARTAVRLLLKAVDGGPVVQTTHRLPIKFLKGQTT